MTTNKIQIYKKGIPLMEGIELRWDAVSRREILYHNPAYPGYQAEHVGWMVWGYPEDFAEGFTFTEEEVHDESR
jgi:hypothetical protein